MTDPALPSVLIIGSGPNAVQSRAWARANFTHVLAINNAWRVRPDWDIAIFPEDFPAGHQPVAEPGRRLIRAADYVPELNRFGGVIYAGGTMAFTAGYWALGALRPGRMAFIGCDMVYPATGHTHFYGTGRADPLRRDVTLQSLEAKSARLALLSADAGCQCVNLSASPSRLLFPRGNASGSRPPEPVVPEPISLGRALQREHELGYRVESGRYWEALDSLDAGKLRAVDDLWMGAYAAAAPQDTSGLEPSPAMAKAAWS